MRWHDVTELCSIDALIYSFQSCRRAPWMPFHQFTKDRQYLSRWLYGLISLRILTVFGWFDFPFLQFLVQFGFDFCYWFEGCFCKLVVLFIFWISLCCIMAFAAVMAYRACHAYFLLASKTYLGPSVLLGTGEIVWHELNQDDVQLADIKNSYLTKDVLDMLQEL